MTIKIRRAKVRTKHVSGAMNKTEAAYAEVLDLRRLAGEVDSWMFEPIKLRLADNTYYSPDFGVVLADGTLELHEVKAVNGNGTWLWEPAARVKIKVAAEQYTWFIFVEVGKLPKSLGGGFEVRFTKGGER